PDRTWPGWRRGASGSPTAATRSAPRPWPRACANSIGCSGADMRAAVAEHPREALDRALEAERRALLENDVGALLASTADKLAALRRAEAARPGTIAADRLQALREKNHA